jgi:hypothetical protein
MSKLGEIITVPTEDDTHGLTEAAAIVTAVYDDGGLRERVFGATATDDQVRNLPSPDTPAPAPVPPVDTPAPVPPADDEAAEIAAMPTGDVFAALTPEQLAELRALLFPPADANPSRPPAVDASPQGPVI